MARRKIGRVRLKMAEMLRAMGLEVSAEDVWIQEGAYRSQEWDCARWGVIAARSNDKFQGGPHCVVTLYSYDRMTECVRHGFVLRPDASQGWGFTDVSSNLSLLK